MVREAQPGIQSGALSESPRPECGRQPAQSHRRQRHRKPRHPVAHAEDLVEQRDDPVNERRLLQIRHAVEPRAVTPIMPDIQHVAARIERPGPAVPQAVHEAMVGKRRSQDKPRPRPADRSDRCENASPPETDALSGTRRRLNSPFPHPLKQNHQPPQVIAEVRAPVQVPVDAVRIAPNWNKSPCSDAAADRVSSSSGRSGPRNQS